MIVSVSLNPSIDRTLRVARLKPGELNRVLTQTDAAAGKGVNVALAAAALGEESLCTGFMFCKDEAAFAERLQASGVAADFIACPGAVRVNLKVFDEEKQEITELNGSGREVDAGQMEEMGRRIERYAAQADDLVFTGSLPTGCPADFYRTLIARTAGSNCRVLLDADGERLREGIKAGPWLIKPNHSELEGLCGKTLTTREEITAAANELVRAGVGMVCVSMGSAGALITDGREAYFVAGQKVEVRSTVAAGDSMLAGLAAAHRRGGTPADMLLLGVAAASVRCATPPEETISAAAIESMRKRLRVERIS